MQPWKNVLAAAGFLFAADRAIGATYNAKVLYQMLGPGGNTYFSWDFDDTAQVAAGGQVTGLTGGGGGGSDALVWTPSGTPIDLKPTDLSGSYASVAEGTNGTQQVGYYGNNAVLWNGSGATAVDLTPTDLTGFLTTAAYATSGNEQVGLATGINLVHAMLWKGTGASAVDLNPSSLGITTSEAYGTDGIHQVGSGDTRPASYEQHALLWTDTADSAVDLNPTNIGDDPSSVAYAVSGNEEVGYGNSLTTGNDHALLWHGASDLAVDLAPANLDGIDNSYAMGTNGSIEVGFGYDSSIFGTPDNALLWTGTAASVISLNDLLPSSGTWIGSTAFSVDSSGDAFGVAQGTFNGATGYFAVEWTPIPEPTTAVILLSAAAAISQRRQPRKARHP